MIVVKNKGVRKFLSVFLPLLLIPLCVAAGAFIFPSGSFAYTIVLVALLSIAAFFGGFEQKKTGSRRLILVAVMVALSVIGRFIPFFKPISAITVLTAVYFGREAGFLTGSLSAVISDIYFGMGPWTPFQMLSFGLIGFFAGIFGERLKKSTPLLLVYGGLSGIVFSFIMDVWTVAWYSGGVDPSLYVTALYTAIPYTVIYSASNILFLALFAKPLGRKFDRIKNVYSV